MSVRTTSCQHSPEQHTAGELHRILLEFPPARRRWARCTARRANGVSKAAVARVIASYLWDAGMRSESEFDLHRRLKDRVGRALSGSHLSAETLEWFIGAFDLPEPLADQLWDHLTAPCTSAPTIPCCTPAATRGGQHHPDDPPAREEAEDLCGMCG